MPEPEPMMPGDGRFPEDPEFTTTAADEAADAMRNVGRMLASFRDTLLAEGFSRDEAIALCGAQLAAMWAANSK